ncbi:MAG: methionyl-tRNA formyltransferase [Deltaproteobacteria bacterium]
MKLATLAAAPQRLVFFGTPALAASVLGQLLRGPDTIVGVFTRPDARRGRGMELLPPPVKQLATEHGIPVFQPTQWRDGEAVAALLSLDADLGITAAYGRILPQEALDAPRMGCINVHASLLPRWRGADPIRRAILTGDPETGVTIMQMVLQMDAGASLWQRRLKIADDETLDSLEAKLAQLGGQALCEALQHWREEGLEATPQDEALITMAPLAQKADGRIDWHEAATAIERRVRAFSPWPGATTLHAGHPLRLWRTAVVIEPDTETSATAPGTILKLDKHGILIATGEATLRLIEIQPAGKKRMAAADWARGARLCTGGKLGI